MVELDLPETRLVTRGFWYTVSPVLLVGAGITPDRVPGTLHAAEHAGIGILPLFTICDRWDVGGVSTAMQADTGAPTIVVYDGYPGVAGIAVARFLGSARLRRRPCSWSRSSLHRAARRSSSRPRRQPQRSAGHGGGRALLRAGSASSPPGEPPSLFFCSGRPEQRQRAIDRGEHALRSASRRRRSGSTRASPPGGRRWGRRHRALGSNGTWSIRRGCRPRPGSPL